MIRRFPDAVLQLGRFVQDLAWRPEFGRLIRIKNQLPAVKGLGPTGRGSAFDPSNSMHGIEGITGKPVLCCLSLEVFQEQLNFP